jgi:HEAT repeat protein
VLLVHGVDKSEPSLISALSNNDPFVRIAAAARLIEQHDYLARPAIEKTLSTEKDNRAKMCIASALVGLGDPTGASTLESMCTDASLPIDDTVHVVQMIESAQRSNPKLLSAGKCADVVLSELDSVSEDYQRQELLSVLPSMIHDVPKDKADRMVTDAQNILASKDVTTRMRASDVLADMGSTASMDLIRSAMDRETDPFMRARHQNNYLKLLPQAIQAMPKEQANQRITDVQNMLTADILTVRIAAGHALVQMGSTASIELIRNAIQQEKIDSVRSSLQKDLTTLETLQQQPAPAAPANLTH